MGLLTPDFSPGKPILDFWPQHCTRINVCLKPPSLYSFPTAATGKSYKAWNKHWFQSTVRKPQNRNENKLHKYLENVTKPVSDTLSLLQWATLPCVGCRYTLLSGHEVGGPERWARRGSKTVCRPPEHLVGVRGRKGERALSTASRATEMSKGPGEQLARSEGSWGLGSQGSKETPLRVVFEQKISEEWS